MFTYGDPQSVGATIPREPRKPAFQYVLKTRENKSKVNNWIIPYWYDSYRCHCKSSIVSFKGLWSLQMTDFETFFWGEVAHFPDFSHSPWRGPTEGDSGVAAMHCLVSLWWWLLQNVPSLPPLMVHRCFYKSLQFTWVNKRCVIQVYLDDFS